MLKAEVAEYFLFLPGAFILGGLGKQSHTFKKWGG